MEQIIKIAGFIIDSFIRIWPYLIITIPIAVFVKLSGASGYISTALGKKPVVSIFLATVVGAFSQFCSCGVIPIIASLLLGGVPLAPVMSFWIASPSMDPEIFFLSTATIGWKLSVWRLIATFVISLLSGYITHISIEKGWLGKNILKEGFTSTSRSPLGNVYKKVLAWLKEFFNGEKVYKRVEVQLITNNSSEDHAIVNCCVSNEKLNFNPEIKNKGTRNSNTCRSPTVSFKKRLLNETLKAIMMVVKFMSLAFIINALIQFYVPQESMSVLLSDGGFPSIALASIIGIPFYTSNITALPLISGLLEMGMNEGAALTFLISGPVTTLPAMAAVWGLVRRKVFFMYVSYALIGSVIFGILITLVR